MDFIFLLAVIIALITTLSAADLFFGIKNLTVLSSVGVLEEGEKPSISVIVPACNEEAHLAEAISSFLDQSYPHIEIIIINDRSTDKTAQILSELQIKHQNILAIEIEMLPEGWMGKAHALHCGAARASGDYLLFTDGDVRMEKTTIARALNHVIYNSLDHLSLIFRNTTEGILLNSLILDSGAGLIQLFRPWLVRKNTSPQFMGVGAFNLVKKDVYHKLSGHNSIRMHPIDDIMLGKIIKRNGFTQDCLLGTDLVNVPWYDSIAAMVNGLMKNVLAIINFNFYLVPLLLLAIGILNIAPLWGAVFTEGPTQAFFFLVIMIKLLAFYLGTRLLDISPLCALATLITPYISFYIVVRAAWLNFRDKGIYWRGTFYPLSQLRKNKPILP